MKDEDGSGNVRLNERLGGLLGFEPHPDLVALVADRERLNRLQKFMQSDAGSYFEVQIPEPFNIREWIDSGIDDSDA